MDRNYPEGGQSLEEKYNEIMQGQSFEYRDRDSLEQPSPYTFVESVTTDHVIVSEK